MGSGSHFLKKKGWMAVIFPQKGLPVRRANPIFGTGTNDVNHLGYPANLRGRDRRCGKIHGKMAEL